MGTRIDPGGGDANGGNNGGVGANVAGRVDETTAPLDGSIETDGLNPKQEQALIALLNHPTVKHAADACGVGERTLHTWLRQPAFGRAYRAARRASFSHAVGLCQRYAGLAVNTLGKIMTDPNAAHASKVAAATATLKFCREGIELDDLVDRVETLEAAAKQQKTLGLAG